MNAILVTNHFLNGEKYKELHSHLFKSAKKCDINLKIKTNLELASEKVQGDFVLFWDKDINLARRIEKAGIPTFNSSEAIRKCDDKALTYIELENIVKQPKTLISPKCYFEVDLDEFVNKAIEILGFPMVFKECFGSYGFQVYLCNTPTDIFAHITDKPFILQEFIAESSGCDKRLEVVDSKVVACARRVNKSDFRSNVTNGGKMEMCTPSEYEIGTAIKACETLGLTFGGVDILDDGSVCEVNSNAHIINIMNSTGVDIASLIFNAIKRKI